LNRYNFVVVLVWLNDPGYVAAVERMFGVPGVARRDYRPWCEAESYAANKMIALVIRNETMVKLTASNRFGSFLCEEIQEKEGFP
jgi:hypothetical protein